MMKNPANNPPDDFDEYLRQSEPHRRERAESWKTAIGLQAVDGLKPSEYLIETAKRHIEGDISMKEVRDRIDSYYQGKADRTPEESGTEEADKVSASITRLLNEKTFTFSPAGYISIHRRIFTGVFPFAGQIRDYNITKKEWVLRGDTVLYASAEELRSTLEYDFEQESMFDYKGISHDTLVAHFTKFISGLWQIHPFAEGNTRTTALFAIKYLRFMGFNVNNKIFADNAWYFRNALVRANYRNYQQRIEPDAKYLECFFRNVLLGENNTLKNRYLLVLAPQEWHKLHASTFHKQKMYQSTKDMIYTREKDFEEALVDMLTEKGWEKAVLKNYTEKQLIRNWANIIFENNRGVDRLNESPLTSGEMQQILDQIGNLKTPLKLNGFINSRSVTIVRDNINDDQHFGKEISLKIYDPREIAAGQSRYQIVQQPQFASQSKMLHNRRGDLMLLINGMPVFHIELKKSGIPVSQACYQIEKYAAEGLFTGLFSLVQIFAAMTPEESVYFANPGAEGKFNPDYYFHWADFNNEPLNGWRQVASTLLSLPMAHQLIGFYTVADDSDGILKVMRSYQYFAASAISDKVAKTKWEKEDQLGGYIWHTTGSGKTMTSFKAAQLIASSKDADKVVFLMDRIELGTQSLKEYRGFASETDDVQATENTGVLVKKLKSSDPAETLIVTSIQKMSNIRDEAEGGMKAADIQLMKTKRIVFIIDECHRTTFGKKMLPTIKRTFPKAIFFGFTGTPIQEENQKKMNTMETLFGDCLHRYSIADGIRDKNVLGFDPYMVLTYKDKDLREVVALEKARASSAAEALADPEKSRVFYEYMKRPMAGYTDDAGNDHKGIEDFIPNAQYQSGEHRRMVMQDIRENWLTLSHNGKFHALLATSSIPEAMEYYRLFKAEAPELKMTALFDPGIDNNEGALEKETGLEEIIEDYNRSYGQDFKLATFARMKKDIAARLAHKKPYERIEREPGKQIDLLIVVEQMLTGFDSKWINTLYLDKMLAYENIIQAFSRTNRLFGPEKPFGTIKYYRRPHTMKKNIEAAVKLYSGDKPLGLFAERLNQNLECMNDLYAQIKNLFREAGVEDFKQLPEEVSEKQKFADLFRKFNEHLEAAIIQGFHWEKREYVFTNAGNDEKYTMLLNPDETTYKVLALRYKELLSSGQKSEPGEDIPYDISGYLTTIDTDDIDVDYMNSRFDKYLKLLTREGAGAEAVKQAKDELHKTFATLSQEEQKFADIFLHDIQRGDVVPEEGKTLRDYITEYRARAKNDQIHRLAVALGLDEARLRNMMASGVTEMSINEFARFDDLKATVDKKKAKSWFEAKEGVEIIPPKVPMKIDNLLRTFIISGGFDIQDSR